MKLNALGTRTDPREIMGALAHAEQIHRAQEELDRMLIEGLASGPGIPLEELDWASLGQPAPEDAGRAGKA